MSATANRPRVIDNDRDEITVTLNGKEIRGWSYRDDAERRKKMLAAREFVEGWLAGSEASAASDMLEALRWAEDELASYAPDPACRSKITDDVLRNVRVAIAKAEGREASR